MSDTHERLLVACRERGMVITADERISEQDAAELLGIAQGSLKNMRALGSGPPFYRRPVASARVSYRICDLAKWLDEGREDW